ncbi:hypothetical protein COW36_08385 [bacterium (Candidatus Blackallbacteria) CG17_big_fil_post_rev_8_21_14_2_50_48_46]|uniref:Outer membrane protein beta-barrel domain-containing protein n=1 Tax=bacterium (Candidatus Blackallbacteria) CG17_big_fil_post_rev_8_21_14_2_50_48_46 TaxID=2014261 RepID=A0A2M7G629_9BACT|nr:MAG: hypothetical protein COW64_24925 [bacterium (Candidatus Blackallbacteria) CG18_big_fil_WC_8_21_14_2_50_49_26]PIW17507.1 MAG: hypothetical protein COW36_08385 [bacterium (Candidatus Blackallbacteria) CG17_big_fil_post_rev_8_21_14_2_50_48_46]PIW48361.1 MAG: hypothetical protein COW20_09740 [bacterium (Candidatus Blackallbacteria) CG13_big_fil_rev_8_21_14_2_50_49_14]
MKLSRQGRLWALGISFALLSFTSQAQAEPSFNLEVFQGAKAWYSPGFSFLDTSSFNGATATQGYTNLSGTFLSQGGGAHLILDRIILGGSGYALSGFRTANATGEILSVNGGYGLFNLGYLVYSDQNFSLYPMLGIGSGNISVSGSSSLNKLFGLSSTEEISRMDSNQVVLDIGLGADYMIDFNGDPANASGLLVGLKLGYLFVASPTQWEANRRILGGTNLPNLSNQGLYFNLTLGGGTQRSQSSQMLGESGY